MSEKRPRVSSHRYQAIMDMYPNETSFDDAVWRLHDCKAMLEGVVGENDRLRDKVTDMANKGINLLNVNDRLREYAGELSKKLLKSERLIKGCKRRSGFLLAALIGSWVLFVVTIGCIL